ncbi:MAG TPA: aminodeoxychorismate/anthranilate synthase component II [Solidesulfovibrio magneticus]|nr:aminodeoxychorismate/anthranilate synthase component II [Solidesulfovibrio magneticus]
MQQPARVVMIDNYDSFTYNIVQYIGMLGHTVQVVRNDRIDLAGLAALAPDYLVISPGPKAPADAGVSLAAIRELGGRIPILGVCLGHQCINEAFGGRTIRAPVAVHGKVSAVRHQGAGIFAGCPAPLRAARYHSLAADPDRLGRGLQVTAWTDDGVVMGLRHEGVPVEGVQFHPESFLTQDGLRLLSNFFGLYRGRT